MGWFYQYVGMIHRIVSFYQTDLPKEIIVLQKRIFNHFDLDINDHFVNGQTIYDRFMKYGPLHFEGKE